MKQTARHMALWRSAVLCSMLGTMTACIDSSYDLQQDIDFTLNVGGDHLTVPIGNTERITLEKIITLDTDDDLQVLPNGEYHLLKSGSVPEVAATVGKATVDGVRPDIKHTLLAESAIPLPGNIFLSKDISDTRPLDVTVRNVDSAIQEIGSIVADTPAELRITLRIDASPSVAYDAPAIDGFSIDFPDFLVFAKDDNLNGKHFEPGTVQFVKDAAGDAVWTYKLYITGYHFGSQAGEGAVVGENRELALSDAVTVHGTTSATIRAGSTGELVFVPELVLAGMPVGSLTGVMHPSIDETHTSFTLSNLPDFLMDDNTQLDIANPVLTFRVSNPLQAPVELSGVLTGEKEGKLIDGSSVVLGTDGASGQEIVLEPGMNTIALSRTGSSGVDGAKDIHVPDLNNLIRTVPDRVNVALQPAVNYSQYHTLFLDHTYTVTSDYAIDIPLSFGSGLEIAYTDTIDGLGLDIDDSFDIRHAVLALTVDNTIPLQLEVLSENVVPIDADGNRLDGIRISVEGSIGESTDGTEQTMTTSQLTIKLDADQTGIINHLDGLTFTVTALAGQAASVPLVSTQWMQLRDMQLSLPGGIDIDLN